MIDRILLFITFLLIVLVLLLEIKILVQNEMFAEEIVDEVAAQYLMENSDIVRSVIIDVLDGYEFYVNE